MSRPPSREGSRSRPSSVYSTTTDVDVRGRSGGPSNEICVLLKPPPSAHTFLNIQIQLVNGRSASKASNPEDLARRPGSESSFAQVAHASTTAAQMSASSSLSEESTPTEAEEGLAGHQLSRTSSQRSNRSSSGSSFFSTTSKRATTPLYTLEYHRVLPTVVLDAGTEVRIAKVLKRGIEIHELAQIEAVELTPQGERPTKKLTRSQTPDVSAPTSPTSTSKALPSLEDAPPDAPTSDAASTTSAAAADKSLFGRFKRMSFKPKDMGIKASPSMSFKAPTFNFRAPSFGKPPALGLPTDAAAADALAQGSTQQALGMFKTEAPNCTDDPALSKHAPGYVWTVRKFLRPDLEGKESAVDMCIEWRKRSKHRRRRERPTSVATTATMHLGLPNSPNKDDARRHSTDLARSGRSMSISDARLSLDGSRPPPPVVPDPSEIVKARQRAGAEGRGDAADSGNESDAEDSESPWVCDLVLSVGAEVPPKRIRLGVFQPAPHHPRMVGQLSIPLSLKRVSFELPTKEGYETAGSESLSAEESKDLLCITLLWLCIRESLGGVASRRKSEPLRNL